jgi:hypothetical protein
MPLIEIKNRWNGEIMHSGEYADLRDAVVSLVEKNANLRGANLRGADLRGANLCGADLRESNLRGADLREANLCGADLRGADLREANLCGADLYGADLRGADLREAKNAELPQSQTIIVPDGDLRVWKKCRNGVIVHLLIPYTAKRSNATGRKCRAEFADVLEVIGAEFGISQHDGKTVYRKGERVTCDSWCEDRWTECGGGIHFYLTRIEAEAH